MPTLRKTTKKTAAPRRTRTRASSSHVAPAKSAVRHHNICQSCHVLPSGSMELMALLLVLVFSLSAVLFTSVYALQTEQAKVQQLTTQLQ